MENNHENSIDEASEGALWLPARPALEDDILRKAIALAIGRANEQSVTLPVNLDPTYPVLYKTFISDKIPSWVFWEVVYNIHPLPLIKKVRFPIPIKKSVGLVIDPNKSVFRGESKHLFLQAQREHLLQVSLSTSTHFANLPTLLVCLRHDRKATSLEELIGKKAMLPHTQIVSYQLSEIDQLVPVLREFLSTSR